MSATPCRTPMYDSKVPSVSRNLLAKGRGRWLAVAASLAVSAGMLYAQSPDTPCCRQTAAVAPTTSEAAPTAAPNVAIPAEAELLAASAISVMFPEITTIGGYRQDALKWHPNGLAIDVMIPNHGSKEGIELGNQIAGLALANAKRWGILHVIWRQGFYPGIGAPSWTADYGNETANHFDHVHISTDGGGYPTGNEIYYIGSMSPAPKN